MGATLYSLHTTCIRHLGQRHFKGEEGFLDHLPRVLFHLVVAHGIRNADQYERDWETWSTLSMSLS